MDSSEDAVGREARFRSLFDSAYPDLLRFVERRVHASHAEDVVADAFLVAWRRFDGIPPDPDAQRAWLFGVARRSLLNNERGHKRQRALAVKIAETAPDDSTGPAGSVGDDTEVARSRVELAAAWPKLSATDQEALALVAWDGLSSPEAASVLGISAVAFRLRLSRARRALRRQLDDVEPAKRKTRTSHQPSASEG